MDSSAGEYRQAFSRWMRTGIWPPEGDAIELKFNPWHDPDDGRFTFANAGRYFPKGGGSGGEGGTGGSSSERAGKRRPGADRNGPGRAASPDDEWRGGGFTGGGGGGFGGAGASGRWAAPSAGQPRSVDPDRSRPVAGVVGTVVPPSVVEQPAAGISVTSSGAERWREIVRNGYKYEIDARGRTRRVSGALTTTDSPMRSRRVQAEAGGAERRQRDDGGHYIAPRFNGPAEAFNHFAHDSNANRGRYRVLEDEWARAKRQGKHVTVKVVPSYEGGSSRPSRIDIWFTIDGVRKSQKISNERAEKPRAK